MKFETTKQLLVMGICLIMTPTAGLAEQYDRGRFTTDPVSGLDWLDLHETIGRSYEQVANGAGGFLAEGWRIATAAELDDLFGRVTGVPDEIGVAGGDFEATVDLIACLGATLSFNVEAAVPVRFTDNGLPVQQSTIGAYDDLSEGSVGLAEVTVRFVESSGFTKVLRWSTLDDFRPPSTTDFQVGVFLVRDTKNLGKGPRCGKRQKVN